MPLSTVLVVDDEEELRDFLAAFLRDAGFVVDTAANGAEALEAVSRQPLDAIVLDLDMPVLNGFEVLGRLRGDPLHQRLGVVILSGNNDRESIERGLELGADDYLLKPFSAWELEARLNAVLRRIRRRMEPAVSQARLDFQ